MKRAAPSADLFMATPSKPMQPRQGKPLLPYAEALQMLEARLAPSNPKQENIALSQAHNRILAQDVALDRDEPPVARSAMDGYALRSADGMEKRRVVATYFAGTAGNQVLAAGQAAQVMTGGTVPDGADCVVPVERIRREGDWLWIEEEPKPGRHVRQAGEMGRKGRVLLRSGHCLGTGDLGVLAGCGLSQVEVFRQPRVVVLSTGDEVVPHTTLPAAYQVRDSNRLLSCMQLQGFGAQVIHHQHVPDQPELLEEAVGQALAQADLVLTIGGVSMGDKDFLPQVFRQLGVETLFHKLAIQPGKPVWVGFHQQCWVMGLPGNPLSSFVVLELLGRLVVHRLAGGKQRFPRPMCLASLQGRVRSKARPRFLPARLLDSNPGWTAVDSVATELPSLQPCTESGSGDWTSLANANALLFLAPHQDLQAGAAVRYLPLSQP